MTIGPAIRGRACLVTGAAGFIGSHLVRRLVEAGGRVSVMVRPGSSPDRIAGLVDRISVLPVDLNDAKAVSAAVTVAQPEWVFHLASPTRVGLSPDPEASIASIGHTLLPSLNLVTALATLPQPPAVLVRAGTIAEYGTSPTPYHEGAREEPRTPYGAAMLATTHYLEMLRNAVPFTTVTARLALTYGQGQSSSFLVPAMIEACQQNRPFEVRHPDDRRDLIHIDDVIDALLLIAIRQPADCPVLNIATGNAPSMRQVAETIVAQTGCDPSLIRLRYHWPQLEPVVLSCDPTRARNALGWSAQHTLETGIRLTVTEGCRRQFAVGT